MAKPEKDGIILKEETPRITGIPSIESINVERKNYIIEKYKHEKIISREIFKLYPDLTEHEIKKAIYDMITWDENCEIEEPLQKNERQSLFITEHKPTDKKIELNITIKNYPEIYDFSIQNLEDLGSTIFPWMPYDLRVFEQILEELPELYFEEINKVTKKYNEVRNFVLLKGYFESQLINLLVLPYVYKTPTHYIEIEDSQGEKVLKVLNSEIDILSENKFGTIIDKIVDKLNEKGLDYLDNTRILIADMQTFFQFSFIREGSGRKRTYDKENYGLLLINNNFEEGIILQFNELNRKAKRMPNLIPLKKPEDVYEINIRKGNKKNYKLQDFKNPIIKEVKYTKPKIEKAVHQMGFARGLIESQQIYKYLNDYDRETFVEVAPEVLQSLADIHIYEQEGKNDRKEDIITTLEHLDYLQRKKEN